MRNNIHFLQPGLRIWLELTRIRPHKIHSELFSFTKNEMPLLNINSSIIIERKVRFWRDF